MGVSITPQYCSCKRLIGYIIRGGPNHVSAIEYDPYIWSAMAFLREDDVLEIVAMSGVAEVRDIREVLRLLKNTGKKIKWERRDDRYKLVELD
jgi:predicted nucleic acid-binding Zn finger protein